MLMSASVQLVILDINVKLIKITAVQILVEIPRLVSTLRLIIIAIVRLNGRVKIVRKPLRIIFHFVWTMEAQDVAMKVCRVVVVADVVVEFVRAILDIRGSIAMRISMTVVAILVSTEELAWT